MSRVTEMKAKDYLTNSFQHSQYKFMDTERESGFDLWMEDDKTVLDNGAKFKPELRDKIVGTINYHEIKEIQ